MKTYQNHILVVFSDVNFSPQLFGILQELHNQKISFRVLLIGDSGDLIGQQIKTQEWNLRIIPKRNKSSSILNLFTISVEIMRFRPKVLFASGQFATVIGMFAAKVLNVPSRIFIRHHSNFHHKYRMRIGILLDKITNYSSTEIIAVSTVVKKILISDEAAKPEKVKLIHNGVDLNNFRFEPPNCKAVSTQNFEKARLFHIGVVSRLTEWKGVEYTATAFVRLQKEFPNSRLHIVGAFADTYTDVRHILSTVPENAYTLEKINSNIPLFLQELDAFVHVPVGTDDEAFGIVYIEALASGIPCIFTQSGVINELDAPDSYAHIVAFRNSEEIYMNLKRLIQGENNSKIAVPESWLNQFSLDVMARSYADLLLGEGR
ncbi:MAG: glycosyltransferase family 4 protein [Actinobacteria bacterium]|nr:glycosyltransferase family 4 protein [Actinomycetota bacterium]